MKRYFGLCLLFVIFTSVAYSAYPTSRVNGYRGLNNQQGPVPNGMQQQQNGGNECGHLNQQEQAFAKRLSTMHRVMFCRHFSVSQRIEAMTIASTLVQDMGGKLANISPDEAVEVVMKNARELTPANGDGGSNQQNQNGEPPYRRYDYPSRGGNAAPPYYNY